MMPRSMDAGFSAGLARPPGPAGGRGFKGVIRPVVLGIAAFQVFANFEIPTAPEAGQIKPLSVGVVEEGNFTL